MDAVADFGETISSGIPVGFPEVAVHDGAKSCHSVETMDFPAGSCLLETATDQILAGSFDLTTSDRKPRRKANCVVQIIVLPRSIWRRRPAR
jgi:hypothetical protein